ncbi:potassium channel family protein [Rathayibacter soli]|uniref:potassium channel family protein n=1 Tax=Rathayibacter soli TaxID=3144168 RepID=UPI0027E42128|nr:ion channel [Glaciibacter superstes]
MARSQAVAAVRSRVRFRDRWERVTRWPLLGLSAAFIVVYSLLVLAPLPSGGPRLALVDVFFIAWAAFVVDFVVRFVATPRGSRAAYARQEKVDLASAVLPLVRPFKLLRLLHTLPGFRGNGGTALRSRVVVIALAYAAMFVYIIALTELAIERHAPHATIVSFGDSIWWACVTIATVGYGDYTPVTVMGRILAVVLMVGGVAIIGTASALIVSYLSERITHRLGGDRPLGHHDDLSGRGRDEQADRGRDDRPSD